MRGLVTRALVGLSLVVGGAASRAHAGFDIQIFSDAALTTQLYEIQDNGPGDSDNQLTSIQVTNNPSGADLDALNAAVSATGLAFSSLSATTNNDTPGAVATLNVNGQVQRLAGAPATAQLYVLVSANDYNFPVATAYSVGSSASHTFTNVGAGTSPTFTSWYNANNVLNARQTATTTLVFAPPAGTSSQGLTSPDLLVSPATRPYSLTNVTGIRLTGTTDATDQFTGSTTVRAVPEPGSLALILLGGSALGALQIRRRKAQA